MKAFIEKYEDVFVGISVFFLILGDMYLISYISELTSDNPIGASFLFLMGFVSNIYFYHLYKNR